MSFIIKTQADRLKWLCKKLNLTKAEKRKVDKILLQLKYRGRAV